MPIGYYSTAYIRMLGLLLNWLNSISIEANYALSSKKNDVIPYAVFCVHYLNMIPYSRSTHKTQLYVRYPPSVRNVDLGFICFIRSQPRLDLNYPLCENTDRDAKKYRQTTIMRGDDSRKKILYWGKCKNLPLFHKILC